MRRKLTGITAGVLGALLFAVVVMAAVELTYFVGTWTDNGSLLSWGTASELDSAGFYLWRSTENIQVVNGALNTSQATKVSPFIPGVNGGCDASGDDYSYLDTTANPQEDAYYYFIESKNCSNAGSVFYGSNGQIDGSGVLVIPGTSSRLFLPIVEK